MQGDNHFASFWTPNGRHLVYVDSRLVTHVTRRFLGGAWIHLTTGKEVAVSVNELQAWEDIRATRARSQLAERKD